MPYVKKKKYTRHYNTLTWPQDARNPILWNSTLKLFARKKASGTPYRFTSLPADISNLFSRIQGECNLKEFSNITSSVNTLKN